MSACRSKCLVRPPARQAITIAVVLWITSAAGGFAQEHDEALAGRFVAEAPTAWARLREATSRLQGKTKSRLTTDGVVKDEREFELRFNETDQLLIEQSILVDSTAGTVYALNSDYAFLLKRDGPHVPWVVTHYHDGPPSTAPESITRRIRLLAGANNPLTSLMAQPLTDVVGKKQFRVLRVSRYRNQNTELAEIHFDYPNSFDPARPDEFTPVQGGVMRLDPQHYWCVRWLELRLKSLAGSGTSQWNMTLADDQAAIPVPRRSRIEEEWELKSGKKMVMLHEGEYEIAAPARLPGSEQFRLSAFGLPEPANHPRPKRTPVYVWVLAAAGLFAVAGLGLRVLAKRLSAA